jgi:hypothetical protein
MPRKIHQQRSPAKKMDLPPESEDKEQSRLFIEKAREIGADEERSRADELIERLAKKPPEPRKPK